MVYGLGLVFRGEGLRLGSVGWGLGLGFRG